MTGVAGRGSEPADRPADRLADRPTTVFFGSGSFAVPILEALASSPDVRLIAVVSAPDRPAGRGGRMTSSPVAMRARELGLPLQQPSRVRGPEAIAEIATLDATLGVLADYGQIIPADLIRGFAAGILNVHPSLLPRHRGATPIPSTILAGDDQAGVTIIRMDEGLDTGPIVATTGWRLDGTETSPDLEHRAAEEGAGLLMRTLGPWLEGSIEVRDQPSIGATISRTLRRENGRLDPHRTVAELERQVRAYQPWPGTWFETHEGRVTVWSAGDQRREQTQRRPPSEADLGTLTADGVIVADGVLFLGDVQLAGGKRMEWASVLRGHRSLDGSRIAE